MKIKTSKLVGISLDWAVTLANNMPVCPSDVFAELCLIGRFNYSTSWAQGGPIIEHLRGNSDHQFRIESDGNNVHVLSWPSAHIYFSGYGPTLLIAALRCYVASKLGDEVEVPEELLREL